MARPINLGNGNLLVSLDHYGQVHDFYFPQVGMENQTDGHYVHRIGVWVDHKFSWLDSGDWQISVNYISGTMASDIKAFNPTLQVSLNFTDVVYNEKNIFLRKVVVKNHPDTNREIRIFFHQEFEIYQSHRGDTAYYDPFSHALIHYKGRRIFLINALSNGRPFDDYSVGLFNIEGKEGTYKDAEDGVLSKNSIEHGLVDSVLGITLHLAPHQSSTVYYWIAASKLWSEINALNEYVLTKTPVYLFKSTIDYWHAWVNKQKFSFFGLPEPVVDQFKKSLLTLRTHTDNSGGIIASGDSELLKQGRDTYSYVWPRDAAFCAIAMNMAGNTQLAKNFFVFCNEIITPNGYFLHKYRTDKSFGSSWHPWVRHGQITIPIQEDETAEVIWALWQYYILTRDLEFVESVYQTLVKSTADFLVSYRDPNTGLPKATYDLWEEHHGIFTFTAAAVYGALIAASKFAGLLGKTNSERLWANTATEIQDAIMKHLYDSKRQVFYKRLHHLNGVLVNDPTIDMSSVYGIFKFGVLEPGDIRLREAFKQTVQKLTVSTTVGGLARYENDMYFHVSSDIPGNPWIITSLWLAQYQIAIAKSEPDFEPVKNWLSWVIAHASSSGTLSEQLHPYSGMQLSATPLSWSHAEYVVTVIEYLKKLEELGLCLACVPIK